ncbi:MULTISPECIES: efflux transporter outer membrane subunit [Acetobacteraceae]|uniref:Secretion protein n=1 Tax=Parasaccharibacter apium TaxID=1510841 RepID=A0ABX4ZL90_9PROT|nr:MULTISPECIES: efflux transporter outer membrane subunit [Acetobacteraceae]POS62092.1 secretion protein [Parasaccharibacter apium]POS65714.1 secretion protein [Parasaccharibacter apium]POS65984.1 secretion protein [Parasaccharibacter apium]
MKMRFVPLVVSSCLFLTSCMVGPEYRPDRMKVPGHFASEPHPATKEEIAETEANLRDWWAQFHDPVLDRLVEQTIRGNYDLQVATQHVLAEQSVRRQAQANWYPQLDANAGGGDNRYSINVDNWPLRPGNPNNHPHASVLTYGARASWEIDVFGHISRQVQERKRLVEVSIEERRGLLLSLLSQLVTDYVELRTIQTRMSVTEDSIRTARDSTQLVERLFNNGVGNTLAIAQSRTEEHAELARLPPLRARQEQLIHAINVLMGEMPGKEQPDLEERRPIPTLPPFPAMLPSAVLTNRPDIRSAERRYAASVSRIGITISNLYPNFSIPLTFNPNASAAYQAFQIGGMSWNVMMMASLPILHGGKYSAQIAQARSEAEASRLQYRQTVLNAFREVEDSLDDWHQDNELVREEREAATQAGLALSRARKLYAAGLTGYLDVLNSQQTYLSRRVAAVSATGKRMDDAISLYIAFGAGWQGRELSNTTLKVEQHESKDMILRAFSR